MEAAKNLLLQELVKKQAILLLDGMKMRMERVLNTAKMEQIQ